MANATINTVSVSRAVVAALKVAQTFAQRVEDIRAALPSEVLTDKAALADALRPGVAKFHGIELTAKSTGRLVFPADHAASEAARQDLSRLVRAVMGQSAKHTERAPVKVNKRQVAQVQDIIAGMTKAEARALFAAVIEAAF